LAGVSFDALRVKLLLAPKKQGIVTSFRSIKKKRQSADESIGRAMFYVGGYDDYETVSQGAETEYGYIWGGSGEAGGVVGEP